MSRYKDIFIKYFTIYIIVQVPLDLLTSFSLKVLESSLTFGIIIRTFTIFLMGLYLLLYTSSKIRTYLVVFGLLILSQLYFGTFVLGGSLFSNINFQLRIVYFVLLILTYFNIIKDNVINYIKLINYNGLILGIVFLFTSIFNLGLPTYIDGRLGSTSWFLSGNEIGVIVGILSIFSILAWLNKSTKLNALVVLLLSYSVNQIGTKSSFFLFILSMFIVLYTFIIDLLKKEDIKKYLLFVAILGIFGSAYLINPKLTPPLYNIKYQYEMKKEIDEKLSYVDGDQIPSRIVESRYKNIGPKPNGEYEAKIDIGNYEGDIKITGFVHIKGTDTSHPNYVTKYIEFENVTNGEIKRFELKDIYYRDFKDYNIDLENYDASFTGIYGLIETDKLDRNIEYNVRLYSIVDDYELIVPITFTNNKVNIISECFIDLSTVFKLNGDECENTSLTNKDVYSKKYNFLLSGRDRRVMLINEYFNQQSIYQKLLGLTYMANHEIVGFSHLEMDFFEIFYTYGYLGSLIVLIPLLYLIVGILRTLFIKFFANITDRTTIYLGSIGLLSLLTAFFAGHTITRPSVVIYLVLNLVILNTYLKSKLIRK